MTVETLEKEFENTCNYYKYKNWTKNHFPQLYNALEKLESKEDFKTLKEVQRAVAESIYDFNDDIELIVYSLSII